MTAFQAVIADVGNLPGQVCPGMSDIPAVQHASKPDFVLYHAGSIVILNAVSPAAREWVDEHLPDERQTWGRNGTVVEARYIDDIIDGAIGAGLTI